MMKIFTLVLALAVSFGGSFAFAKEENSALKWTTNYSAAMNEAKVQNKIVFLCFTGSDWCPWSKKMESEILLDPEFQQQLKGKFIFVRIDLPRNTKLDVELKKQNERLYEKFHLKSLPVGRNRGFPAVILLDPDGNKIGEFGYQAGGGALYAKKFIEILDAIQKKGS